jgi:hypothetical protein
MYTPIRTGIVRSIFFDNDGDDVIVEEYSRIRWSFFIPETRKISPRSSRRNFLATALPLNALAGCYFSGDLYCQNRTDEDV